MLDPYKRHINYLRISVTDRCNFRCVYCMPAEGIPLKTHDDILSFDEIKEVVRIGAKLGISKIRITGGEPLVRKNLPELIRMISEIDGIEDIGLSTNGVLLRKYVNDLKAAGLKRVNISLDTLNPEKFKKITRVGELDDVLAGIDAVLEAGFHPIKINFVCIPGENEADEKSVKAFCGEKNLELRFIRQMNLKTGEYYPVEGGSGGNCSICNRLRLTTDGYLVPCLHSEQRVNIREFGVETAFLKAIEMKPEKGIGTKSHEFSNIGG